MEREQNRPGCGVSVAVGEGGDAVYEHRSAREVAFGFSQNGDGIPLGGISLTVVVTLDIEGHIDLRCRIGQRQEPADAGTVHSAIGTVEIVAVAVLAELPHPAIRKPSVPQSTPHGAEVTASPDWRWHFGDPLGRADSVERAGRAGCRRPVGADFSTRFTRTPGRRTAGLGEGPGYPGMSGRWTGLLILRVGCGWRSRNR